MRADLPRASVNEGSNCTNQNKVTGTVWLLTFLHYMNGIIERVLGAQHYLSGYVGPKTQV
jgi:hypothetical protein